MIYSFKEGEDMKKVNLGRYEYELIEDKEKCFNLAETTEKLTDYFDEFDYIFGDYAYDKLRLKGFNDKDNKNRKEINDIKHLDLYIEEYCAYGAKYFLLKKIKE